MALVLYCHPLASFCWKPLVGLYELGIPFENRFVDLAKKEDCDALATLWPLAKLPVLRDEARGVTVPESTLVLEYVGGDRLVPSAPDDARECRLRDRFFDLYVQLPMQKIVGDRLRPADRRDPYGVEQAKAELAKAYAAVDDWIADGRRFAMGDAFTLADCAAAPALYYANEVVPLSERPRLVAYLARLAERPSFARVLDEAEPFFAMFPR